MMEESFEKVITIGVNVAAETNYQESMVELINLCSACEYESVTSVVQNLPKVIGGTYLGEGKLAEIKNLAAELNVHRLVFNDELTPSQIRNIEKATDCVAMDRSALIIEIFVRRAKTREAKLQVEIAALKYMLPRLTASNANLAQQSGGSGVRNKGAGEKQIDIDKYIIGSRLDLLSRELKQIAAERKNRRKQRSKRAILSVAIVGYTNAGKSTLMNYLLTLSGAKKEKQVLEKDMLFATLDTSVRKVILPSNKSFIISDTVGFVSRLPHDLIQAFRSTLEEAKEADLLLNVVDLSNPNYLEQKQVTLETLKAIGVEDVPIITVYNKLDCCTNNHENSATEVYVSSKSGAGISKLLQVIEQTLFADYSLVKLVIPYSDGQVMAILHQEANIITLQEEDDGFHCEVEVSPIVKGQMKKYIVA